MDGTSQTSASSRAADTRKDAVRQAASSLHDEHAKRRWAWLQTASITAISVAVLVIVLFAAFNHPHRAVIATVATLYVLAGLRCFFPEKPWFGSRRRWVDVALYVALASAMWFLSPYTATISA